MSRCTSGWFLAPGMLMSWAKFWCACWHLLGASLVRDTWLQADLTLQQPWRDVVIVLMYRGESRPREVRNHAQPLPSRKLWSPLPLTPWQMHACSVVSDSVTPWTVAHQAPLCLGLPRQEYWIFLTQGSNPLLLCLLHCRQISLTTEPSGKSSAP